MHKPGVPASWLALVVVLLSTGCSSASPVTKVDNCTALVRAGAGFRGTTSNQVFLVINGSESTCALKPPTLSLVGDSGTRLDVAQDWAPGASDQVLRLGAHKPAAVPYSITSLPCGQTLRFRHVTATFGAVSVAIALAGETCPGSRIRVSTPIPARICANGSFTWASPGGGGLLPEC
jgi:hypothetical protein